MIPGASRLENVLMYKRETGKVISSYCMANTAEGFIFEPDGYVYNCNLINKEENRIGQFFPKIELYKNIIESYRKRSAFSIQQCAKCSMKLFCGGGCPSSSITQYGSIDKGFCGIWKNQEILSYIGMGVNVEKLYEMARKYEK